MKNMIPRTLSSLGLALALTTLASTAHADIVNYSFSVTTDTAVGVYGDSFSGAFSFDDSQVPTSGISGEALYSLTSFSFNFNGATFGLGDLFDNFAAFEAGQFTGLEVGSDMFSFLPALALVDASFGFDLGQGNAGNGVLSYVEVNPNSVPEPATGALLVVGLMAAVALRKARTR